MDATFSETELAYLRTQRLGRLATQHPDGTLQNSPVGFRYNPTTGTIDIGGRDLERSRKYRNVAANGRAAFVVDDLASVDPWRPRCVEVRGRAEVVPADGDRPPLIRVHAERVISFGLGVERARPLVEQGPARVTVDTTAETRMRTRTHESARFAARVREVTVLTSRLNLLPFDDDAGRSALLAEVFGAPLPPSVTIYPPFFTEHGLATHFGERVFVNQGCTFMDGGGIWIGDDVMIGPKVNLITSGHPADPAQRRDYLVMAPIVVGANAWIGAAATVLPGVTIGHDAVVGAGAVVAKDVAPGTLVTGPGSTERRRWEVDEG